VSGICAVGNYVRAVAQDGTVTCGVDKDTTYTAGNGLSLTRRTFSADTNIVQQRVTGTCSIGSFVRGIGQDGSVACGAAPSSSQCARRRRRYSAFGIGRQSFGAPASWRQCMAEWPSSDPPAWSDFLYEFAEHLFWEPQHIHRAKKQAKPGNIKEVRARLAEMEVPLNAQTGAFFALAPKNLRRQVVEKAWDLELDEGPALRSWFSTSQNPFGDYLQEDLALETPKSRLFLEAKVESNFSKRQVAHYVWGAAILEHCKRSSKRPVLLLVGPGPFSTRWKKRETPSLRGHQVSDGVRAWLGDILASERPKVGKRRARLVPPQERADDVADHLDLRFATWNEVIAALDTFQATSETEANLVSGYLHEIRRRKKATSEGMKAVGSLTERVLP
jgi:hypothetical protein